MHSYTPIIDPILAENRLSPLGPGTPNEAARTWLKGFTPERALAPHKIHDIAMARACLAGLWLYHDFLDESHEISQEIHTAEGSFWHGIMHRREPDAWNSKYWFRRVGSHPIFEPLARAAADLGLRLSGATWSPFDFVDLCEKHRGAGTSDEMVLRQVQAAEWRLLFDWCFLRASGGAP